MDHRTEKTLHHAAHLALHTEVGRETLKAVGTTITTAAIPSLASPAAPLAVGALAVAGAGWGISKLVKWLNS